MSKTIGAFAPVRWTDEQGGEETVLFIIGNTPQEIEEADKAIFESFGGTGDIENITVIELTEQEWWDAKHGTNISKGWYVIDTADIERIIE